MCPGDLAELRLVVTDKVAHVVLCGILDVGQLLADPGEDDVLWGYTQLQDQAELSLTEDSDEDPI